MSHHTNHTAADQRSTTGAATPKRLLGVWAHPDDEAYLASGLMSRVVAAGGAVTVLVVTDGELGFPADDARDRDVRSRQRRAEMLDAMSIIGVHDVRFLGIPDGAIAAAPLDALASQIATVMAETTPDVVVTFGPDGITGHPDHIACGEAVTTAWLSTRVGDLWYAAKTTRWLDDWRTLHDNFGIWMTDEPAGHEVADLAVVIDLAGGDLDHKRRVLGAHGSQTKGVAAAFGEQAYLRWICQESFRRPTDSELFAVDSAMCIANWCHPGRPVTLSDVLGALDPVVDPVVLAPDRCTSYRAGTVAGSTRSRVAA